MGATLRERASSSAIGPAVLQGLVRGADGQPVPGARICAVDSESDSAGIPQATCVAADAQGRYALMLPLAGVFSIAANAPGYEPGRARNGEAARPGERASLEHGTTRQPAGPLRQ
jgi:hypothetical protein